MSEQIRITDLGHPRLTDQQQGALAYTESLTIHLTPDSILEEALQATGLDDFGSDDFVERLSLLCDEWGHDTDLLNLGRLSLRNKLLQHAKNRLLIRDVGQSGDRRAGGRRRPVERELQERQPVFPLVLCQLELTFPVQQIDRRRKLIHDIAFILLPEKCYKFVRTLKNT